MEYSSIGNIHREMDFFELPEEVSERKIEEAEELEVTNRKIKERRKKRQCYEAWFELCNRE